MSTATGTARWNVDPSHSLVEFAVRHMMFATVKGRFGKVEGYIQGNPDDLTDAVFEASIDTASIDTREENRDAHLRSADFFDVAKFPQITFRSREVAKTGDNTYKVTGDLTIRDATRPVTLDVEMTGQGKDPWGNQRMGLSARTSINRKDFGLTWNAPLEAGGWLVGDKVDITIEVEAVRQQ
ncbi:MAG: polyisoprenoid-binding protein [Firmicutes bacterium]|nr:polyisoprenoid-binding protein [Bacillota bacterium]